MASSFIWGFNMAVLYGGFVCRFFREEIVWAVVAIKSRAFCSISGTKQADIARIIGIYK